MPTISLKWPSLAGLRAWGGGKPGDPQSLDLSKSEPQVWHNLPDFMPQSEAASVPQGQQPGQPSHLSSLWVCLNPAPASPANFLKDSKNSTG